MGHDRTIDATTLRRELAKVLGEVTYGHTRFKITKNGKIIAEICPPTGKLNGGKRRLRTAGR
jgi:prevent-host-death family protein